MTDTEARVLVVDDERAIRRYLHAALNAQGYTVYEAANGQEALNAAVANRPDLIILDLGLPDIDGVEITRRLREWTNLPILILSVREQESDKIAALDAGADDYLTKPFSSGELLARMRVALRRSMQVAPEPVFEIGRPESRPCSPPGKRGRARYPAHPHRIRLTPSSGAKRWKSAHAPPASAPGMGKRL